MQGRIQGSENGAHGILCTAAMHNPPYAASQAAPFRRGSPTQSAVERGGLWAVDRGQGLARWPGHPVMVRLRSSYGLALRPRGPAATLLAGQPLPVSGSKGREIGRVAPRGGAGDERAQKHVRGWAADKMGVAVGPIVSASLLAQARWVSFIFFVVSAFHACCPFWHHSDKSRGRVQCSNTALSGRWM